MGFLEVVSKSWAGFFLLIEDTEKLNNTVDNDWDEPEVWTNARLQLCVRSDDNLAEGLLIRQTFFMMQPRAATILLQEQQEKKKKMK